MGRSRQEHVATSAGRDLVTGHGSANESGLERVPIQEVCATTVADALTTEARTGKPVCISCRARSSRQLSSASSRRSVQSTRRCSGSWISMTSRSVTSRPGWASRSTMPRLVSTARARLYEPSFSSRAERRRRAPAWTVRATHPALRRRGRSPALSPVDEARAGGEPERRGTQRVDPWASRSQERVPRERRIRPPTSRRLVAVDRQSRTRVSSEQRRQQGDDGNRG